MALKKQIPLDKLRPGKSGFVNNMIDKIFGRLTVTKFIGTHIMVSKNCKHIVEAKCECGDISIYDATSIKRGDTTSCGCYQKEWTSNKHKTHGHSIKMVKSRTYNAWLAMKSRCCDESSSHYYNYGALGVIVCERWLNSFENFIDDMGEVPEGKTLDRYPNLSGNYEPTNCRWATREEQANNTRRNRFIVINDEKLTLSQAAKKYHFSLSKSRRIFRDQNPDIKYNI